MCWNCGCMMPDDDHGKPDNITTEKLRKAAKASGPDSIHKLITNMLNLHDKKVHGTPLDGERIS
ncbi:MAG: hypothetical protein HY667_06245 [Chloroflexi bacterium]|nr:hypothetical protein [Chloroflexota bacterium]